MKVRVAINGFGRIGKLAFRLIFDNPKFQIVAINDLASPETISYLLKYDSAQKPYKVNTVSFEGENLIVEGYKIPIFQKKKSSRFTLEKIKSRYCFRMYRFFHR